MLELKQKEDQLLQLYKDDVNQQRAPQIVPLIKQVIQLKEDIFETKLYEKWENNQQILMNYLYHLYEVKEAQEISKFLIENLQQNTDSEKHEKIKMLENISSQEQVYGTIDRGLQLIEQAFQLFKTIEDTQNVEYQETMAYIYVIQGRLYHAVAKFEYSMVSYSNSMNIYEKLQQASESPENKNYFTFQMARGFGEIGGMCFNLQGYEQAQLLLKRSESLWQELEPEAPKNPEYIQIIFQLGLVQLELLRYEESETLLTKTENCLKTNLGPAIVRFLVKVQLAQVDLYTRQKKYQKALDYISELDSIQKGEQFGKYISPDLQCMILYSKSKVYLGMQNIQECFKYADQGIKLITDNKRQDIEPLYPRLNYIIGQAYIQEQNFNFEKAIQTGQECIDFGKKQPNEDNDFTADGQQIQGFAYLRSGKDIEQGLELLLQAVGIYSSFSNKIMHEFQYVFDELLSELNKHGKYQQYESKIQDFLEIQKVSKQHQEDQNKLYEQLKKQQSSQN